MTQAIHAAGSLALVFRCLLRSKAIQQTDARDPLLVPAEQNPSDEYASVHPVSKSLHRAPIRRVPRVPTRPTEPGTRLAAHPAKHAPQQSNGAFRNRPASISLRPSVHLSTALALRSRLAQRQASGFPSRESPRFVHSTPGGRALLLLTESRRIRRFPLCAAACLRFLAAPAHPNPAAHGEFALRVAGCSYPDARPFAESSEFDQVLRQPSNRARRRVGKSLENRAATERQSAHPSRCARRDQFLRSIAPLRVP